MPVTVLRRSRRRGVRSVEVHRDAAHLLRKMNEGSSDLVISLVDDEEMKHLNGRYRHKDKPTDVLAFASREGLPVPGADRVLGDVVISLDTAARQAEERGRTLADEVRTLLIHGILHLLGYDHERGPADARKMKARERKLLSSLET